MTLKMRRGLRNEAAFLLGATAAAAYYLTRGKSKLSRNLAIATAVLRAWPAHRESFENKSVIITGGSRGLGLELAKQLAEEGARVAILARDPEELAKAANILDAHTDNPSHVLPIVCDVTNDEQSHDAFYEACEKFGGVDMLINNAGAILVGPSKSMTREDYLAQLELHLFAAMRMTNLLSNQHGCALKPSKKRSGPRIVNIISMGGKVGVPHMLPYDVSKFALAGYSQGVSSELASQGISVTSVYPALMQTGSPIQAVFKGEHEKEYSWFASADNLPGLSMDAEKAASLIIEAARRRDAEVILSSLGRMRELANAFIPETMAALMAGLARLLPAGQSDEYKTGAEASAKPLSGRAKKNAAEHNQTPKTNAAFNLGLNT